MSGLATSRAEVLQVCSGLGTSRNGATKFLANSKCLSQQPPLVGAGNLPWQWLARFTRRRRHYTMLQRWPW